jgi:hypothetical protein
MEWQSFLKNWKLEHPTIKHHQAQKQASIAFQSQKDTLTTNKKKKISTSVSKRQQPRPGDISTSLIPVRETEQKSTPITNLTFQQEEILDGILELNWLKENFTPSPTEAARMFCERVLIQLKPKYPKLRIGTIKSTQGYGNTSVSMGASYVYMIKDKSFHGTTLPYKLYVLNYGGGGPNLQVYHIDPANNFVAFDKEFSLKRKSLDKSSGNWKNTSFHDLEVDSKLVYDEIKMLFLEAGITNPSTVKTLGFITGGSREAYYNTSTTTASSPTKQNWKDRSHTAFNGLVNPWTEGVHSLDAFNEYFLPQKMEGIFELIGIQAMYSNLKKHYNNNNKDKEKIVFDVPIASFGVGSTTTQFAVQNLPKFDEFQFTTDLAGFATVIEAKIGMKRPEELTNLGNTAAFANNISNNYQFNRWYQERVDAGEMPILALKSGCLLQRTELLSEFKIPSIAS